MSDFPNYVAGRRAPNNARQLQNVVDAAEGFANLQVQAPLTLTRHGRIATLGIRKHRGPLPVQWTTVVLTEPPDEVNNLLTVRQVRYEVPPVAGVYQWASPPITVYPDFGHEAVDYAEFLWTGEGVPTLDAGFLRAFKKQTVWFVELPSAAAGPSVIATVLLTAKPTDTDTSLTVRKVNYTETDPPVEGQYEWDGEDFEAFAYFGAEIKDYIDSFSQPGGVPTLADTYLQAFKQQGIWIVELPGAVGGLEVGTFTIVVPWDVEAGIVDHLECEDVDGGVVLVAKPWLLRRTPFHSTAARNEIRYSYSNDGTRVATIGTGGDRIGQRQTIITSYQVGDEIVAIRMPGGTGVIWMDEVNQESVPVDWLELDQGRSWGRTSI